MKNQIMTLTEAEVQPGDLLLEWWADDNPRRNILEFVVEVRDGYMTVYNPEALHKSGVYRQNEPVRSSPIGHRLLYTALRMHTETK